MFISENAIDTIWNDTYSWSSTEIYLSEGGNKMHGWFNSSNNDKIWHQNFSCSNASFVRINFTCLYSCEVGVTDGCIMYFNETTHTNLSIQQLFNYNTTIYDEIGPLFNTCNITFYDAQYSTSVYVNQIFQIAFQTYINNSDENAYLGISDITLECNNQLSAAQPSIYIYLL